MASSPADDAGLVRAIGLRRLTATIVNVTIGAGIFVLPAVATAGLGAAAPIAYLVCAAAMTLVVLCFAAAGSRVSLTGGLYAYIEVAFGPYPGFIGGVLYWLAAVFAVASVASAFVGSIGVVWPAVAAGAGRATLLAALFGGLAAVNVRGVGRGAGLVEVVTIAKLVPLVVFVLAGVWFVHGDYLAWPAAPAAADVGRTAIVLIFAFVGVEIALVPSGEIADPARTVPRALFAALAITTALYLLIQGVAQGILGPSMTQYAAAPLAEAAARVLGPGGRLLVVAGAAISMFGYVSGDMLGTPRVVFAFARDGFLPRALARVDARFHAPGAAIVVHALFVYVLAVSSSFTELAVLANVSSLSLYLLCVAASYGLQRRDVRQGGAPYTLPGGPIVPLAAAAVIVWLLAHATMHELAVESAVLALATALYVGRALVGRAPAAAA